MALFWLSDKAWTAIEPHLPKNQPGAWRVDDRRVISGILHVRRVGRNPGWLRPRAGTPDLRSPRHSPPVPAGTGRSGDDNCEAV
jgi:hypothetical protein